MIICLADKPISDSDHYASKQSHLLTIYSPNDDSSRTDGSDGSDRSDGSDGSDSTDGTDDRSSAINCQSGGKVYANGDKWHPIIGPLGPMECVLCLCNRGSVECSRVACDPLPHNCLKVHAIQGQCCQSCAELSPRETNSYPKNAYSAQHCL